MIRLSHAAAAGAVVLALVGAAAPAQAALPTSERTAACFTPDTGAAARGDGSFGDDDTRGISAAEQQAIELETDAILDSLGGRSAARSVGTTIPVYFHVMMDAAGNGDVTREQIDDQIDVLNATYAGAESAEAADTGFTFTLAGVDRWYNDSWHKDKASNGYRSLTRQGGADALNIWLVDFKFLGIATFPFDYDKQPLFDGVRLQYTTLPGGTERNYNLGETATHEVGHWLGLYHVFQGGCMKEGDEVDDTPAQSTATNGCPGGQDSCPTPGVDSIHNYMDYSYDTCYNQFTPGQTVRMNDMWAAYRGA
ncbi:MAG: zinc metalloprotease [Nocardioides sp.]